MDRARRFVKKLNELAEKSEDLAEKASYNFSLSVVYRNLVDVFYSKLNEILGGAEKFEIINAKADKRQEKNYLESTVDIIDEIEQPSLASKYEKSLALRALADSYETPEKKLAYLDQLYQTFEGMLNSQEFGKYFSVPFSGLYRFLDTYTQVPEDKLLSLAYFNNMSVSQQSYRKFPALVLQSIYLEKELVKDPQANSKSILKDWERGNPGYKVS